MNGYRCAHCGRLRRAFEVTIGEGHQGIACSEHPGAPVLMWNREHEYALIYLDHIATDKPWLELDEWAQTFSEDEYPGVSRRVMAEVAVLYGWGFRPVERQLPERTDEQKRAELDALYGSKK